MRWPWRSPRQRSSRPTVDRVPGAYCLLQLYHHNAMACDLCNCIVILQRLVIGIAQWLCRSGDPAPRASLTVWLPVRGPMDLIDLKEWNHGAHLLVAAEDVLHRVATGESLVDLHGRTTGVGKQGVHPLTLQRLPGRGHKGRRRWVGGVGWIGGGGGGGVCVCVGGGSRGGGGESSRSSPGLEQVQRGRRRLRPGDDAPAPRNRAAQLPVEWRADPTAASCWPCPALPSPLPAGQHTPSPARPARPPVRCASGACTAPGRCSPLRNSTPSQLCASR